MKDRHQKSTIFSPLVFHRLRLLEISLVFCLLFFVSLSLNFLSLIEAKEETSLSLASAGKEQPLPRSCNRALEHKEEQLAREAPASELQLQSLRNDQCGT